MVEVSEKIILSEKELNIEELITWVQDNKSGAICSFIGTVRDNLEGQQVEGLEYECYEKLAIKEINNIIQEIKLQYNITKILIAHRIGLVSVGQPGVIMAVSSVHRPDALKTIEFLIENLKKRVPIWKRELLKNGSYLWK